jgi:hypothetical protein
LDAGEDYSLADGGYKDGGKNSVTLRRLDLFDD